ncbi:VirD2 family relaxase/mobilization nuclease [Sphingomonas sp. 67-41]|uniref:relaxase/mobilization nuclease domain-containing protein n=1 Tax=Sphingomonas TaxID=13687 RepID=UPI000959ADE3|nr:VirD2 family relaxase/mobilization nuclease [Sphingomonas sp. 67-41]OJY48764.1 MAG: type VI secretion protein [Sphingomonas sp. 67-41]
MTAGDDDLRVRPGKGRSRGSGSVKPLSLAAQVKRAAARAGFARRPGRRAGGTGRLGRGRGAALSGRRSATSRRVIVKARIVRHSGPKFRAAPLARHIAYLERDGVTRDGRDASLFDARSDRASGDAFAGRCADDRHHFRFIVSPEDAGELADLKTFTRELMGDMSKDLGTRLDWVAVDHWNTDNPHVHILVRGVAEDGADLVIDRCYISHGLRDRAEARVTLELGPRTEQEIQRALDREVEADRWTSLDNGLQSRVGEDGIVDLRPLPAGAPDRRTLLFAGRAQKLERLGLATPAGPARWTLRPDIESRLRELGDRGDIIKSMHRAMRDAGHAIHEGRLAIHPPGTPQAVTGRLVARGLQDELTGTAYAIVDGVDGRHHHLRFGDLELTGDAPVGAIVELRGWQDRNGVQRSALAVRSDLPIESQVTARGATWLDRQLLARDTAQASVGFGAEVREAMAAREDHLVAEGLATRMGKRVTLAPNLIDTLRSADLREASARIAARTGLTPYQNTPGSTIAGTYRERVTLASGRFAMIDDGLGFQLVPWRPALDRQLGATITGTMAPGGGIDWTFGRSRGLGI